MNVAACRSGAKFLSARSLVAAIYLFGLAGCVPYPNPVGPVIDANKLVLSSSNARTIVDALRQDASALNGRSATYYEAAVAGFNFVDDQCAIYFDQLFYLNRRKDALKNALTSFNQTTNAILAVTDAQTLTMAIVAQAFGLATNLVEIVSGTYLYELPPSATLKFVDSTRSAYRIGAAAIKSDINSPAETYHQIQSYLALCQPPTIEAMLSRHIANATGVPISDGASGQVNVITASSPTVDEMTAIRATLRSSQQALPEIVQHKPNAGAISAYERTMGVATITRLQRALCFEDPDGVLGPETREAFSKFLNGAGISRNDVHETGILRSDITQPKVGELIESTDATAVCTIVGGDLAKLGERFR
jgi:hypothetical protein